MSVKSRLGKAIRHIFRRCVGLSRFLDDERNELVQNRALIGAVDCTIPLANRLDQFSAHRHACFPHPCLPAIAGSIPD